MTKITIVTYHYVREIRGSKYPNLKGLEFDGFKRQLDFLEKNFSIVNPKNLINHKSFKKNSCMLTFDDGFKDHINYVLPELKKRKIMACFFPPAKPILNQTVLDTHLIHFILEKTVDFKKLNLKLFELLKQHSYSNDDIEKFCKKYSFRNKFDNEEISFFKRMLQKVLPLNLRNKITKIIFEEKFDKSIGDLSKELYLNKKDLIQMLNEGMIIGSHSYNHFWLDTLSKEEQSEDLDLSINFLKDLGAITKDWMMCYPFGAYNNDTIDLLKSKKCSFAFTTNSGLADLTNDPYKLKRKDTTEFPQ